MRTLTRIGIVLCMGLLPSLVSPAGADEYNQRHAAVEKRDATQRREPQTSDHEQKLPVIKNAASAPAASTTKPDAPQQPQPPKPPTPAEQAQKFLAQELITAQPFTRIFNAGAPPRVVWRDLEEVKRLGADGRLRVRWFDAGLNEATGRLERPGRWGAWIEGTAPNGTPMRRAMTFYCRPPGFLFFGQPGAVVSLQAPPALPAPASQPQTAPASRPTSAPTSQPQNTLLRPTDPVAWREHHLEMERAINDLAFRGLNDSEAGAILLAGMSEAHPLGRPAREVESLAVRNDDYHLALKLKVLGLADRVRPLQPPHRRPAAPAPVLREGTAQAASVRPEARQRIEAVCRAWADDTGEPFVTLVARNGVIIAHCAAGRDTKTGQPIGLDYRCPVFSITKTVTGILFSQFLDQGLIKLDDPVSTIFPDFPTTGPEAARVPTFRQCFVHTSGLSGHGAFGGVRNPHLDNFILNALHVNEPGRRYEYSGMGFELAAQAMAMVTGKSWRRVYEDHLFAPLGLGDVPMTDASAGASFTARELGVLAQWMANRGSYGELEFISPQTFEKILPESVKARWPAVSYHDDEGIGNHWMRPLRPGAPLNSKRDEDRLLSRRTIGHGSLSACMFMVDLEHNVIIVQARKQAGPRHGEWSPRLLQAIAESLK